MLVIKFAPEQLAEPSLSRNGHKRQRHMPTSAKKFLSPDIVTIIENQNFWNKLYELQDLILPICAALNKLQKDMARLYEVVLAFGWITKACHSNEDFFIQMITHTHLQHRLNQWEQPILLLSLVLHPHPQYHLSLFNKVPNLSYTYFGQWINYYYQV